MIIRAKKASFLFIEFTVSISGEFGLETVWGVVEPCVENSAVAPARVLAESRFLFEDNDRTVRVPVLQLSGDGDSNDTAPNYYEISGGEHGVLVPVTRHRSRACNQIGPSRTLPR